MRGGVFCGGEEGKRGGRLTVARKGWLVREARVGG